MSRLNTCLSDYYKNTADRKINAGWYFQPKNADHLDPWKPSTLHKVRLR